MTRLLKWRRTDGLSLEILRLSPSGEGFAAQGHVVDAGDPPFALRYDWQLDAAWRTRHLTIQLDAAHSAEMRFERTGPAAWRIDGRARPDLDGCAEIDLSPTPFCNTLALRRFGPAPGAAGEMIALFVPLPALAPVRSRQRYDRLGPLSFRYVDLGAHAGFEARLDVDPDGLVIRYEGLFERLDPTDPPAPP